MELKKLDKTPVDVVADYINSILKHAESKIESSMPTAFMKMCQRKFVLTVPAVWSAKAMNATQEVHRYCWHTHVAVADHTGCQESGLCTGQADQRGSVEGPKLLISQYHMSYKPDSCFPAHAEGLGSIS